MPVRILGISAYYHDSAACLVEDGRIVAAAQEERFTRKKHDAGFPSHAVEYCLREAGITVGQLDLVGFYEKPLVKFSRLLETYVACAPRGLQSYLMAMPLWLGDKLWMGDDIREQSRRISRARFCSASITNRTRPRPSIRRPSSRRRSSRWTASASGRPRRSASAAATRSSC